MARLRAKKRLGQHFLTDQKIVDSILNVIQPTKNDSIVEIGPGQGVLTVPLAESGARLVAVEFDRELIGELKERLGSGDNCEVVQQDFLKFEPHRYKLSTFKLVGNLPYNITSPVIDWCITHRSQLQSVVLMVQKELAQRICAKPKSKDWSPLSIMTQLCFDVTYQFDVPAKSFDPPPKVVSAVFSMAPKEKTLTDDIVGLKALAHVAFRQRRKQLRNNLVPFFFERTEELGELYNKFAWPETIRAEEVSLPDYVTLLEVLTQTGKRKKLLQLDDRS